MRQFRAIFGVSTQASAAVMAIFLGGLGAGALLLGRRLDQQPNPLRFYGRLELFITLTTLLAMISMILAKKSYLALGGSQQLGGMGAGLLRLGLASLIIGPVTFLMGGTLAAMSKVVTDQHDSHRLRTGLLYGVNALGAFCGGLMAAFWLHERVGVIRSLLLACSLNLLVAGRALFLSRTPLFEGSSLAKMRRPGSASPLLASPNNDAGLATSRYFAFIAAASTGFIFLLLELVWYRMLSPLLGGTTYSISLILCTALLGIGLGGCCYPILWRRQVPTLSSFSLCCAAEAVLVGLPFAWGDHLAIWVATQGGSSLGLMVTVWIIVVMLVVFPASLVAGLQFPMLIALLGRGQHQLGRQVGQATVLNSLGAILGSLAGGFGLMVLLSAPGVWRLSIVCLILLAAFAFFLARRQLQINRMRDGIAMLLLMCAVAIVFAPGPGAPWRHAGIGVGRAGLYHRGPNGEQDWINVNRRHIVWEKDGIESSVAISDLDGYAFLVNGKTDGNSLADAHTQVMSGLVGAALHPNPQQALVVGLGTGSTAGWLAQVPSIERVEVVELEAAVLEVARLTAPVNEAVLNHPKVDTILGDAREYLLTSEMHYDLIISEPSNPYRAGISSLYTRQYYQAVLQRLYPDGIFLQWLQGYSVDETTISRVYSTLLSVFPHVETWLTGKRDMILLARLDAPAYDPVALGQRLASEPYARGMQAAWRVEGLEGFLSRFYANQDYSRQMARFDATQLNTDDCPFIEFAMARSLSLGLFDPCLAWQTMPISLRRPVMAEGAVDWDLVDLFKITLTPNGMPMHRAWFSEVTVKSASFHRMEALMLYYALIRTDADYPAKLQTAYDTWSLQDGPPVIRDEWLLLGEWAAYFDHETELRAAVKEVRKSSVAEAEILLAMFYASKDPHQAGEHLLTAFREHQADPWPRRSMMVAALMLTPWVAANDSTAALLLFNSLCEPFAVESLKINRLTVLALLADAPGFQGDCRKAFAPSEPHVPWQKSYLRARAQCYERTDDPKAAKARTEFEEFKKAAYVQ